MKRQHLQLLAVCVVALCLSGSALHVSAMSAVETAPLPIQQPLVQSTPEPNPGQIVHLVLRSYERRPATPSGGPPHADVAALNPETQVTDVWAVAGANGRIARVATYVRDSAGKLIQQTVVNENGQLTSHNLRYGSTASTTFSERGLLSELGGRSISLQAALAITPAQARRDDVIAGNPASVLEPSTRPDPILLAQAARSGIQNAQSYKRRLAFDRASGTLIRDEDIIVTAGGTEQVLRSKEWPRFEILEAAAVPAGVLAPTMPTTPSLMQALPSVAVTKQPPAEAARALPFALYALDRVAGDNPNPTVARVARTPIDLSTLPVAYRGPQFAVERGEAAEIVYVANQRYLALIEGSTASLAASFREVLPFWETAKPLTLSLAGTAVSGWYLSSPPVLTTNDPVKGTPQQAPGPTWIFLPDVRGTAILLMAQGYSEQELVSRASGLRRVS